MSSCSQQLKPLINDNLQANDKMLGTSFRPKPLPCKPFSICRSLTGRPSTLYSLRYSQLCKTSHKNVRGNELLAMLWTANKEQVLHASWAPAPSKASFGHSYTSQLLWQPTKKNSDLSISLNKKDATAKYRRRLLWLASYGL